MATRLREGTFREIFSDGKISMFVSERAENYNQSMRLLADNGLRPITYQELLMHAPELIERLSGKWFYIDGIGLRKRGTYAWNKNGELVKLTGNEVYGQIIRVYPGNKPLSFGVRADENPWRFNLVCDGDTDEKAPVVIGIINVEKIMERGRDALTRLRRESSE